MSSLLCKSKVKEFALHVSKEHRNGKFTRVSKDFLEHVEAQLKIFIVSSVKCHPSVGKTLK